MAGGDYPWQVALLASSRVDNSKAQFCGGTLVSATRVLTAAHCTRNATAASIDVLANTTSLDSGGQRIDVVGIDDHPQAAGPGNGTYRYDVSVLELAAPAAPAAPLALIADAEARLWEPEVDDLTVTGWGSTRAVPGAGPSPPPDYPDDLQEAEVPRRLDTTCQAAYRGSGGFSAIDMLCASPPSGGRDTCQGDSGGPIIAPVDGPTQKSDPDDWRLVGVTSWGAGCADAAYPGVYARLGAPGIRSFVTTVLTGAPYTRVPPTLGGTFRAGEIVSCSTGSWGNRPTGYAYAFQRVDGDGTVTPVASGPAGGYTVADGDVGSRLRCTVTAVRQGSSAQATSVVSPTVAVRTTAAAPPASVPAPVAPPTPAGLPPWSGRRPWG